MPAVDEVARGVIFMSLHTCAKTSIGFSSGLGHSTLLEDNGRETQGFLPFQLWVTPGVIPYFVPQMIGSALYMFC